MSVHQDAFRQRRVFVDSSGYLALVNPDDTHHTQARATWARLTEERWRAFTTNVVIAKTHSLFLVRLAQRHATAFLRQIDTSGTVIVRVRAADEAHARSIVYEYDDKDFSLTDAISSAVMQRLAIPITFGFDRHFAQYGCALAHEVNR